MSYLPAAFGGEEAAGDISSRVSIDTIADVTGSSLGFPEDERLGFVLWPVKKK